MNFSWSRIIEFERRMLHAHGAQLVVRARIFILTLKIDALERFQPEQKSNNVWVRLNIDLHNIYLYTLTHTHTQWML